MASTYNPLVEAKIDFLRTLNLIACLFHGSQALGALILAISVKEFSSFEPPLITNYAIWNETMGASPSFQIQGHIPFAYITCLVPLMSSIAHGIVYSNKFWPLYRENVQKLQNPWRWIEYSLSSSLMVVLVAILFAIYDIHLLLALFFINATVMYTGRAMDRANMPGNGRIKVDWEPFIVGTFLAIFEWGTIFMTLVQFDFANAPAFIIPLLFTYFGLYFSFAINDYYYYKLPLTIDRMIRTEIIFMILSFSAKSLLLWLIFFGTRQPHESNPN